MKKSIYIISVCLLFFCQMSYSQMDIYDTNVPWASFRDLSSEKFSKKFKEYSDKGYLMIDVDAYSSKGKTLYSMVWRKNTDNRGWAEYRDMTSDQYHRRWTEFKNKGYRPIDVEAYTKGGRVLYAGIWIENKEKVAWSSKRNLSSSQYSTYFKEMRDKGFRPVDIEAYKIGRETRYAAIWVKNEENLEWAQYRNMTRESYLEKVGEFSDKGYIVEDFERYKSGSKIRYAAIWVKRPGVKYQLRTNRSEKAYANLWREYSDRGYRLIDFEREGKYYAGIWVQNNTTRHNYQYKIELNKLISDYQTSNNLPGLSVAIVDNGKMIYKRGFGFADIGKNKKTWSETVYLQASISKVIGGTIAVKLVSNGKLENGREVNLDLSENTSTYIKTNTVYTNRLSWVSPFFRNIRVPKTVILPDGHNHTIEQLFSHLSCLRHYEGPTPREKHYERAIDALPQIWDVDECIIESCTMGSDRNYSTHAFTYIAAVLERVTGQTSAQLIENEIAKPYNLSTMRAMYGQKELPVNYERAQAYRGSSNRKTNYEENSWKIFGGGIESSTRDLALFGWKVLNGQIIKAKDRDDILWTRVNSRRLNGIGWQISADGNTMDHGGAARGARSYLRILREENLVIAINTNTKDADVRSLADSIDNLINP